MSDIASIFREYARLDLVRQDRGLSVVDHERWSTLKTQLDQKFNKSGGAPSRRSAERIETALHCSFSSSESTQDAEVCNLSTGGVFIRTSWPLPVDAAVRLRIRLEESGAEIEVGGVVVSNNLELNQGREMPGMGVRFVRPDPVVIERISALYSAEQVRVREEGGPPTTPTCLAS